MKWEDVYPHFYLLSRCRLCMGISTGFYYRIGEGTQTTACTGSERLEILQVFGDLERFLQREEESLIFPVMRVIVRFAFWCIRMADVETREVLVNVPVYPPTAHLPRSVLSPQIPVKKDNF